MKHLKIGNIELENRYILGPMAGVTDLPFRLLCREQGAGLLCMEMVSAKAIYYNNRNTESLLEIHPDEKPVSLNPGYQHGVSGAESCQKRRGISAHEESEAGL